MTEKEHVIDDLKSLPFWDSTLDIEKRIDDLVNRLTLEETTHISQEKFLESPEIIVSKNDILMVQRGSIGKVAFVYNEIGDCTINPSMILIKNIKVNPRFLFYYLCGDFAQKIIFYLKIRKIEDS